MSSESSKSSSSCDSVALVTFGARCGVWDPYVACAHGERECQTSACVRFESIDALDGRHERLGVLFGATQLGVEIDEVSRDGGVSAESVRIGDQ